MKNSLWAPGLAGVDRDMTTGELAALVGTTAQNVRRLLLRHRAQFRTVNQKRGGVERKWKHATVRRIGEAYPTGTT